MAFSHPLARAAKVWTAKTHDGAEQRVLVIVTTIPLEPGDKGYKKSLVERLSRAAHDYLADSKDAASFMLLSRLRDWRAPRLEGAALSLGPDHISRARRRIAPNGRFSSRLTVIDCAKNSRARGQRSSRRCARRIGDERHDQLHRY